MLTDLLIKQRSCPFLSVQNCTQQLLFAASFKFKIKNEFYYQQDVVVEISAEIFLAIVGCSHGKLFAV
jgi:hypothetical protein